MKNLLTLLLLFFCASLAFAGSRQTALYHELVAVNKYWQQHPEAVPANLLPVSNEREMIRMHLKLVEKHLRQTDTRHLTKAQQKARKTNLNNLRSYWQSGDFPINTTHAYRLPIFIDPFDNFCAVGYLIKASGHEGLSRHISANSNFAYLADMSYPELDTWAANSGLTFAELAWIQPGYPPTNTISQMQGGTNGTVKTMATDVYGNMYAAGSFTEAGGQPVNNVAMYVSGVAGFSWVQMGSGLNGPVTSLQLYNNELYSGGHDLLMTGAIHSVAKWDGNNWTTTSPIGGFVNAMAVFNNELYVGGYSTVNQTNYGMLFKWDGSAWTNLNLPISGVIHALTVVDNKLIIGGEFTSSAAPGSPNILQYDGNQLTGIGAGLPAKVRAIAAYNDHLFAGGDYVNAASDTFGLARFDGTEWQNLTNRNNFIFLGARQNDSVCFVSALVPTAQHGLLVGGSFWTAAGGGIGYFGENFSAYSESMYNGSLYWQFRGLGMLNKPVYALSLFDQNAYLGGEFTQNLNSPLASIGFTVLQNPPISAPEPVQSSTMFVYPNPVTTDALIALTTTNTAPVIFTVYNLLGQQVQQWHQQVAASGNFTFSKGQLSTGTYVLQARQNGNLIGTQKFVVE